MTMTIGLLGKKCGMTRVFTEEGESVPVTVIEVQPNRITQIKTVENEGYTAVQVTTGTRKRNRVTKPAAGHFAKAGVEPGDIVREFSVQDPNEIAEMTVGSELKVDRFADVKHVDVTGTTIGKGFAGVIKRHHFVSQDETHGNSRTTRAPGSIGQRQSPGKVFKGKKMAGHMGNVKRTIMSQQLVKVDAERNLLLVRGAVPGAAGSYVIVRQAVKKSA